MDADLLAADGDPDAVSVLEFAPLTADGAPLHMAVVLLLQDGTDVRPLAIQTVLPHVEVVHDLPGRSSEERPPSMEPFAIAVVRDLMREGQTLHVVVATEQSTARPNAATLRIDHEGFTTPILDPMVRERDGHFAALRANGTGLLRTPEASGEGWLAASYLELATPQGHTETYDTVWQVEERLLVDPRPLVTARDVSLRLQHETAQGWAAYVGLYGGNDAAGEWAFEGSVHGQRSSEDGRFVQGGNLPVPGLDAVPFVELRNEGTGGFDTQLDLFLVDTSSARVTLVLAASLATPLSALLTDALSG